MNYCAHLIWLAPVNYHSTAPTQQTCFCLCLVQVDTGTDSFQECDIRLVGSNFAVTKLAVCVRVDESRLQHKKDSSETFE
jgi:hypothetical protein